MSGQTEKLIKDTITMLQVDRSYLPPHSDLYPIIKRAVKRRWNEDWSNIRNNKLRNIKHDIEDWKSTYKGNTRAKVIIARLRIGHTLAIHSYLMEGRYAPFCIVPLSVKHLLEECPSHGDTRLRLFGNRHPSISDVLGQEGVSRNLDAILEFLQVLDINAI